MWQLKYKGEFLDLEPDDDVEIERKSPLFLVDDALYEYSTPRTLKYTDKNCRLIGNLFFDKTIKTQKKIDVELYDEGSYKSNCTLVIESAGMNRLFSGDANVSGYLLIGVSDFFTQIQNKKLSDLTLGGTRTFPFTTLLPSDGSSGYWQHIQGTWSFNNDYVFQPFLNDGFTDDEVDFINTAGWGNKMYGLEIDTNMQAVVPWPKLKYILNQIFVEHGWQLDTAGLNDTEWEKLLLFSAYAISTTTGETARLIYSGQPGQTITLEPQAEITIDLKQCMPQDVNCSTFIMQVCKRYGWVPIFSTNKRLCRLIALKEMQSKAVKNFTEFASPDSSSTITQAETVFAFKNDFEGDDSYPSGLSLDGWIIGPTVFSQHHLPTANFSLDKTLVYSYLENKYWQVVYDDTTTTKRSWAVYGDNIYDDDPGNATDTYETSCTTLPVLLSDYRTSGGITYYGLFPVCNQPRRGKWGIRTILYHGKVTDLKEDGTTGTGTFPYASSTNTTPNGASPFPWSNVFKYVITDGRDSGIRKYWYNTWLWMISGQEKEVKQVFTMALYQYLRFNWDDIILVHNVAYLFRSIIEKPIRNGLITFEATMQKIVLGAPPAEVVTPIILDDVYFGREDVISDTTHDYTSTQYVHGVANSTVTIKVTDLRFVTPTAGYGAFYINGTEKNLNDTFTVTIDPAGTGAFAVHIHAENEHVMATLQIIAATDGDIVEPYQQNYSKDNT